MTFRHVSTLILGLALATPVLADEPDTDFFAQSDETVLTPDVNFVNSPLHRRDAEKRQSAVDAIVRTELERAERKINQTLNVAFSA
jgi:hypothetical protein